MSPGGGLIYNNKGKKKYSPYLTNKDIVPSKFDNVFEVNQAVISPKRVAKTNIDS
jgi:hypothetical protein